MTINSSHLLIFTLDQQRYGLRLASVAQVVRAAAVTPLPQAPEIVLGILELHGEVIPVINLRKRFRVAEKALASDQLFVIARTATRTVALVADDTEGVVEALDDAVIAPDDIVAGTGYLAGVTRTERGLVLIHDLETLLFPTEETLLTRALEQTR